MKDKNITTFIANISNGFILVDGEWFVIDSGYVYRAETINGVVRMGDEVTDEVAVKVLALFDVAVENS